MNLSEFLLFCSGADKTVLEECPTEKNKYYGIGSTVLLTSILACLSGGYAVYFTFQSLPISIILGIFWGLVIFSLDRYIISSIKKVGSFSKEWPMAFPRILMALVLAVTISKPLELRLFQDAINKAMGEISDASISACEVDWNTERDNLAKKKGQLEDDRKAKTEEIYSKDGIYKSLVDDKINLDGNNKTLNDKIFLNNKIIVRGTTYPIVRYKDDGTPIRTTRRTLAANNAIANNKTLRNDVSKNNIEINGIETQKSARKDTLKGQVVIAEQQYTKQIAGVQLQIEDHDNKRQGFISDCTSRAKDAKDIPARLQALSKITSENSSINIASWLITALFILLETAPVVVKLLSSRGPYDEIFERIEYETTIKQKLIISNLNDKISTELKISTERNVIKVNAEIKANTELMNEIALAQAEIAKLAVKKWRDEELDKLNNGTNNIINP